MNYISIKSVLELYNYNIGNAIAIGGIKTEIVKQPCNLGGYRYYFLCPNCNKKCTKLFDYKGIVMLCTICSGNRRNQLNRTKTDMWYYYRLGMKEARKVDPSFKISTEYWSPEFPKCPPKMSMEKYIKHWRKYHHYFDLHIKCYYKHTRDNTGRKKVREPPYIVKKIIVDDIKKNKKIGDIK